MHLICPHCSRSVDYSTERPRFCSFCGQALSVPPGTSDLEAPTLTAAPVVDESTSLQPDPDLPRGRTYQPGDVVGGYRLARKIGAGAMGSVFEAEHVASGQRVAVKLIAAEFAMSSSAVDRFRLEGKLASTISHPRCVFVLAADEEAGQPYIVMELMPGTTLTTLVAERGPLPPLEAIRKILDVISGLQEAHRLGVIHRDVKPSNCFVDANGRVKIGDFGLAKSVQEEGDLTRSGAFVGTVLFASPEQIKRQPLDAQSDVYSVCATLYYLLTGKAPFSGGDALAAATRIVTEDPPPMRTFRPDLPPALDRVVLRGLEREKGKRWADLDGLRQALVRFLPGQMSIGGLGSRFVSHICDAVVLSLLMFPAHWLWTSQFQAAQLSVQLGVAAWAGLVDLALRLVLWLAYYGLLEGIWGWSVGKLIMRLRVCGVGTVSSPGIGRALLRALVSFNLINLGNWLSLGVMAVGLSEIDPQAARVTAVMWVMFAAGVLEVVGYLVGIGAMCSTMRSGNGYRGLHEFASGTRVLELSPRRRRRRRFAEIPATLETIRPEGMPQTVGRFRIEGALQWLPEDRTLVGHDPSLGRTVWITMRAEEESTPAERQRREITRPSRVRWVASGREIGWIWDAYMAPAGVPLPAVVRHEGRLPWPDAAPILEQIADELAAAGEDDSLPALLSPHQVWVGESGRVQILGTPLTGDGAKVGSHATANRPEHTDDNARSVALLREAAAWMLEGRPRPASGPKTFRAPLPRPAARCLNGLFPGPRAFTSASEFRKELRHALTQPAEVTHVRRFGHLCVLALLLLSSIGCLMASGGVIPLFSGFGEEFTDGMLAGEFEHVQRRDLAVSLAQPDAGVRLAGLARYADDARELARLKGRLEHGRARRLARLEYASKPIRDNLRLQEQTSQTGALFVGPGRDVRQRVRFALERPPLRTYDFLSSMEWFYLLLGPAGWVVWAFLSRGGMSLRLLGLEMIRGDGRKAARWQCLWRALLFWTPPVTLWAASLWLDQHYWPNWDDEVFRQANAWMPSASWYLWWAGVACLLLYFAYAVWKPQRSLHDRLAGTWLVPR